MTPILSRRELQVVFLLFFLKKQTLGQRLQEMVKRWMTENVPATRLSGLGAAVSPAALPVPAGFCGGRSYLYFEQDSCHLMQLG